ncbi:MAG: hypothetical protein IT364_16200 [Candidatus Hydrogenedentes bacterium]|nr:hypothetical protein [Candidatus Hydrogenedentota bacterium]
MHMDWAPGMVGMMTLLAVAVTRISHQETCAPKKDAIRSAQGVTRE